MDKAIEDALEVERREILRIKTKGRFPIEAKTNAGNWLQDRLWANIANPAVRKAQQQREVIDVNLIQKRHE